MLTAKSKTQKLAFTALFTAAVLAVTTFVRVPVPATQGGYINLGDAVIFAAAFLLGGPLAAAAAGIGSGLADLLAGAVVYVPGTIIIKALMALAAGAIIRRGGLVRYIIAAVLGGAIMVAGYALYEAAVFDWAYALGAIPFNCIQWGGSVVISAALYGAVRKVRGND
ncbi:MAG: ECF transporter S component [Oscillospiraceae bacterium]|jgi:uncharacterized membrane protein|nr:ECF transporter S component [Oscillospiraceae bacterium]